MICSRAEVLETLVRESGRQDDLEGSYDQLQADPGQMAYRERAKAMMIPSFCDAVRMRQKKPNAATEARTYLTLTSGSLTGSEHCQRQEILPLLD